MSRQILISKMAKVSYQFVIVKLNASWVAAFLFLFIQLVALPAYAQDHDVTSDDEPVQGKSPSAAAANEAQGRLDLSVEFASQANDDQATIEAQLTQVFANHHQVTMIAPLTDEVGDGGLRMRAGDLRFGYSYTPGHKLSASPWVPSNVGMGIGLSVPTGDPDMGTGLGSYALSPRLGFVKMFGSNFAFLPSIQYQYSFNEQANGTRLREWALSAGMTYVGRGSLWVQWFPVYLYDTNLDEGAMENTIVFGKLFSRHFGMSLVMSRVPTIMAVLDGVTTDYSNSYMLRFHMPYGYGQTD